MTQATPDTLPTRLAEASAPEPVLHVHPTRFHYTGGLQPGQPRTGRKT
jgi:hypothetical protein